MAATHGEGVYGNAVGVTTPTDHKMAQVTEFVKTAANTIRAGLLWDGNATVVSGKSNMSYDVRAFSIATTRGATSGVVKWANDATVNVTTTAAPGSNSRYDVVYAWHREYSLDGTNSNPVIGVVQGTAAASPSVPSLSAFPGAVELARILVPAGVTATNSGTTITQTAPFTAADGGVVVARTTTERDLYVPAAADTKAQCWVLADGVTYAWNGTTWYAWEAPPTAFTPSWTGYTRGNGTSSGYYVVAGGKLEIWAHEVLGSSSSMAGPLVLGLPLTTAFLLDNMAVGDAVFYNSSGASRFFGTVYVTAAGSVNIRWVGSGGNASDVNGVITNTSPFGEAWGTSDQINVHASVPIV